jgi:hypothetical protein
MSRVLSGLSIVALVAAVPALSQEAPAGAATAPVEAELAPLLPQETGEAPVRQVTLFEAGLAELTRETGAASAVTLSVPLRDVNDVLKSLLVRGTGITGARLELAGQTPVEDAFAGLPFPPAAAMDLVTLLRSVPGLRVRITERGFAEGREGTLMGVVEDCTEERGCETVLTVLGDDGAVTRHVFDADLRLEILDEEITAALARGLGALRGAASGTTREIEVSIEGPEVSEGALTYVVAAPAWKTAYRALTGEDGAVDLQAWAVIENATGEDWTDVALTLSSGSPRTLTADLHGRDWRYRPQVTTGDGFAPVVAAPEETRGFFDEDMVSEAAPAAAAQGGFAAPAPAPVMAGTEAGEGVLDSRFTFDETVDLAAGEMLSLPFLTDSLDATHLSLWQGQLYTRTGNPDMVLEVTNDLSVRLPAGIMTVSDETGGYVGDADFPLVAPGETEAVPFGVDRRLRVEETVSETTHQVSVRAAEGVIRIALQQVRETGYLVTAPAGEARVLVIDHPLTQGWTSVVLTGPAGKARQDDDGRRWLRVELPVEEEGALLQVRDVYPYQNVVEIGTLDEASVLAWAGQAADAATRAYLEEAARLMRATNRAEDALARAEAEQGRLAREQERVARLLSTVPQPSEAYDRFLADLLRIEDRIRDSQREIEGLRERAEQTRAMLDAHIGAG